MSWAPYFDPKTGKILGVMSERGCHPKGGSVFEEFLVWNAAQTVPIDLSDRAPEVVPVDPDLTLAVQILKTDIPASWKNSVNVQQRVAWALRRVLLEIRREISDV